MLLRSIPNKHIKVAERRRNYLAQLNVEASANSYDLAEIGMLTNVLNHLEDIKNFEQSYGVSVSSLMEEYASTHPKVSNETLNLLLDDLLQ